MFNERAPAAAGCTLPFPQRHTKAITLREKFPPLNLPAAGFFYTLLVSTWQQQSWLYFSDRRPLLVVLANCIMYLISENLKEQKLPENFVYI
jgi:hypothetical protein